MNFQIHNHVDTGQAYDLIVTLIKFNLELRDRVWPCSAIACLNLIHYGKSVPHLLHGLVIYFLLISTIFGPS